LKKYCQYSISTVCALAPAEMASDRPAAASVTN
jgi:hypothetical protein